MSFKDYLDYLETKNHVPAQVTPKPEIEKPKSPQKLSEDSEEESEDEQEEQEDESEDESEDQEDESEDESEDQDEESEEEPEEKPKVKVKKKPSESKILRKVKNHRRGVYTASKQTIKPKNREEIKVKGFFDLDDEDFI